MCQGSGTQATTSFCRCRHPTVIPPSDAPTSQHQRHKWAHLPRSSCRASTRSVSKIAWRRPQFRQSGTCPTMQLLHERTFSFQIPRPKFRCHPSLPRPSRRDTLFLPQPRRCHYIRRSSAGFEPHRRCYHRRPQLLRGARS